MNHVSNQRLKLSSNRSNDNYIFTNAFSSIILFPILLFSVLFTDFVDVTNEDIRHTSLKLSSKSFLAGATESIVCFFLVHVASSVFLRLWSLVGRWSQYAKNSGKFDRHFCMSSPKKCTPCNDYAQVKSNICRLVIQIRYISRVYQSFICRKARLEINCLPTSWMLIRELYRKQSYP